MSILEIETPNVLSYMPFISTADQVPSSMELTPQQAAEVLCVSDSYMDQLLESGEIPFRMVGDSRLISLKDLQGYDKEKVRLRREVLRQLAQESQEMGLYD